MNAQLQDEVIPATEAPPDMDSHAIHHIYMKQFLTLLNFGDNRG